MVSMEQNIRPTLSVERAHDILEAIYDIQAEIIIELTSELDRNFHVVASDSSQYVLKIAHPSVSASILDLQNATLNHLAGSLDFFPQLISSQNNTDSVQVEGDDNQQYTARLLNYLPGMPLADFKPHTPELLGDIGYKLARLTDVMQTFDHDEKRLNYRWNALNLLDIATYATDMPAEKHDLIAYFVAMYQRDVVPNLDAIRHSFIYNDANDHNILVHADGLDDVSVTGMIDFGDMVYSPTIMELAVAIAYIMMDKAHPLTAAEHVIRGYTKQFDLTETELKLLFPLIAARLCMSVCISWYQQRQEPDNPYLSVSEDGAWMLLKQLRDIHPRFAHYVFREAAGLSPVPETEAVVRWLEKQTFAPKLDVPFSEDNCIVLDFSMSNTLLGHVENFADPVEYTRRVNQFSGDKIGIGRYNEARPIYTHPMFEVSHHEHRAIHTAIDICQPAGTPLYAPFAGTVYSVHDNAGEQDYGPTLILKHEPQPDITFYTLYGHLHEDVLATMQAGQPIEAGQQIAKIGSFPRNGNWFPHLHVQVIVDMLDNISEFPGVVAPRHRNVWLALSPNPNVMLHIPYEVEAKPRQSYQDIINKRQQQLNPSMSLSYQQPLKIERGFMHYLYDENGQAYLDCVNNVPTVGHSNPRVVDAAQRQLAVLNTNTRYLHDTITDYAERLCATLPNPLSVCFLVNSGSEANELAIRLARTYTGGTDFVVIDHAYHGNTSALIDLSPYKFNSVGGQGKPDYVEIADMPDVYRDEDGDSSKAGQHYADAVQNAIERIHGRGKKLAAFFAEGILGCGGQMTLPDDYLKTAYDFVHQAGGVCVADEVQTGFGRVGEHFWAFELQGVVPDIVTMGKPMGNGSPLAAVITTREIADAFHNGMEYFNTFGGNPVSCAIGLEVLNIIEGDNLQQNAHEVGAYWMARLRDLQSTYPIIGHVRGSGLFIGVELVRTPQKRKPADHEATYIVNRMKSKGFLMSTEGPYHNVLKVKPPIIFQKQHVDLFMTALEDVLSETVLQ